MFMSALRAWWIIRDQTDMKLIESIFDFIEMHIFDIHEVEPENIQSVLKRRVVSVFNFQNRSSIKVFPLWNPL